MAQKLSENIVKIAMVILIGAIAYIAHISTSDHDVLTGISATLPEIKEALKDLRDHKCHCVENYNRNDYAKKTVSPKNQE